MGASFVATVFHKLAFRPRLPASVEAERAAMGGETIVVGDGASDGSRPWLAARADGERVRPVAPANAG